jgi:ribosome-associated protein
MIESSKKKSLACVNAALEKKATEIVLLRTKGIVSYADYFLICGGRSDRQVQAIAQSIETELKKEGHRALGIEGLSQGRWVLLDFGDVIVHIFQESVRRFYDLVASISLNNRWTRNGGKHREERRHETRRQTPRIRSPKWPIEVNPKLIVCIELS